MGVSKVPSLVARSDIENAASDGKNVLYNPRWMWAKMQQYCDDKVCETAVVLGIMAHELGHHVKQHVFDDKHSHDKEFEADCFAARVLARAGIEPEKFICVLEEFTRVCDRTGSHPCGQERRQMIERCYQQERARIRAKKQRVARQGAFVTPRGTNDLGWSHSC